MTADFRPFRLREPRLVKALRAWRDEQLSFHFYRGPGLTEFKLRIGTTHYRISRWQYKGKPAEWSARRFRPYISATLVSDESWVSLLSRLHREADAS